MNIANADTVYAYLTTDNYDSEFSFLIQSALQARERGKLTTESIQMSVNGVNFEILSQRSRGLGIGIQETLHGATIRYFFAIERSKNLHDWPIRVELSSAILWIMSPQIAWGHVVDTLRQITRPELHFRSRISRLDIAIDQDDYAFTADDKFRLLRRSRKYRENTWQMIDLEPDEFRHFETGSAFTGFTFGTRSGAIHARIYDKTIEIVQSNKSFFPVIWAEAGWDQTSPVWRIEFELKREFFTDGWIDGKSLNNASVEDIFDAMPFMADYLMNRWLSLRIISAESNPSRWPIDPLWNKWKSSLVRISDSRLFLRKKIVHHDTSLVAKQVFSSLVTLASYTSFMDWDTFYTDLELILLKSLYFKTRSEFHESFMERVEKKSLELGIWDPELLDARDVTLEVKFK